MSSRNLSLYKVPGWWCETAVRVWSLESRLYPLNITLDLFSGSIGPECKNTHVRVAQTTSLLVDEFIATTIFVRTPGVLESREWVAHLNEAIDLTPKACRAL